MPGARQSRPERVRYGGCGSSRHSPLLLPPIVEIMPPAGPLTSGLLVRQLIRRTRTPDATRLATTPAMPVAPAISGSARKASGKRATKPPSSCGGGQVDSVRKLGLETASDRQSTGKGIASKKASLPAAWRQPEWRQSGAAAVPVHCGAAAVDLTAGACSCIGVCQHCCLCTAKPPW